MAGRLFLLDGMALIYRAHFAFLKRPIVTTAGRDVSALFGFTNQLLKILEEYEPTHLAVAMDTAEPTERHRRYQPYKATREKMPEALSAALPDLDRLCEAFRIPVIRLPGFEADDIVGTLTRHAEAEGFQSWMVTSDKDFAQLVSASTFQLKPGRKGNDDRVYKVAEVLEEWGIDRVDQVRDLLGLQGDASDNIPGVKGIGRKIAQQLVSQYGSLESIYENLDQLKGKQKERLVEQREMAALSKWLVTIDRNVPWEGSLADLICRERDEAGLQALCQEFEFNSIGHRLFGPDFQAGRGATRPAAEQEIRTIEDVAHHYVCVDTEAARRELAEELGRQKAFCFDLETTGLDVKTARIVGIAFSFEAHRAYYVPTWKYDDREGRPAAERGRETLNVFRGLLEHSGIVKIGHNLKFDLGVLRWHGVRVGGPLHDTMLMHCLLETEQRHGMDFLAERYLRYRPIPLASMIGERGQEQKDLLEISLTDLTDYAAEDADVTWQLHRILLPKLEKSEQQKVYFEIEEPLIRVLTEMEYEGIRIDVAVLRNFSADLGERLTELDRKIFRLAGEEFNLNSPRQLGEILFEKLKLVNKPKKTKTGQYATNEQVLKAIEAKHEIVATILEWRSVVKLKSTYADSLPEEVFEPSGRVHTTYHQLATATGRLNSQKPNLQNIPVRSELGQEIRRAFVPRGEGYRLMSSDYSQIELRILAAMSKDEAMQKTLREGQDIHRSTAARIFEVVPELVTDEMRRQAKTVVFGIVYGVSAFGLSQRLGISRREAAKIIEQFFAGFPGIRTFIDGTVELARSRLYVETMMGRRRYIRDINTRNATTRAMAERNAVNTVIQGTAADLIKIAMSRIGMSLERQNLRTRLLLQVHDELVFDLWLEEEAEVKELVREKMTNAIPLPVPLEVSVGTGPDWLEAH